MKLTRRELAAVVSSTALAAAQTEPRSAGPADALQAARDRLKASAEQLAQQTVPMTTEPAFQFKA